MLGLILVRKAGIEAYIFINVNVRMFEGRDVQQIPAREQLAITTFLVMRN